MYFTSQYFSHTVGRSKNGMTFCKLLFFLVSLFSWLIIIITPTSCKKMFFKILLNLWSLPACHHTFPSPPLSTVRGDVVDASSPLISTIAFLCSDIKTFKRKLTAHVLVILINSTSVCLITVQAHVQVVHTETSSICGRF